MVKEIIKMRLWHKDLISVLPKNQLLEQSVIRTMERMLSDSEKHCRKKYTEPYFSE
jgi:hypothetical protein